MSDPLDSEELRFPADAEQFLPGITRVRITAGYRWQPRPQVRIEYHAADAHESEPGKPSHYHVLRFSLHPIPGEKRWARIRRSDNSPDFFPGDRVPVEVTR